MGIGFSSSSSSSMEMSRIVQELEKTRMEREIAFAQLQEKRRLAFRIAEEREKLNWFACGGGLVVVLSALSSFHHKNLLHLLPIFPTATLIGYKTDLTYGDKLKRISENALCLLEENGDNLVPLPPSVADIRERVKQLKQLADDEN